MAEIIPLSIPDLRGRESEFLVRCVTDNWVSSAGHFVGEFERHIAERSGRAHGVATVNGTAALHLSLVVAGVRPGDRVLLPDFTFAATANAVLHAGGVPYFLDVTRESWTLDPELVAEAIVAREARVAAVIAVHVLGHPADMDRIAEVCAGAGVPVIEDAAGAIGARYKGRPVGALGDAAIFSFNGNKVLTTGGGGMIVTDRPDWAERARALSTQNREGTAYRYREAGFNYRMPNVNAALGLAQLERLDSMIETKQRIAARYDAALGQRDDLVPMPRCNWASSSCWLYSVRCAAPSEAAALVAHLDGAGIQARAFWEALSGQAPYRAAPHRLLGVAASLSGTVVSLPCSSNLSEIDQERVLGALAHWRGAPVAGRS